MGAMSSSSSRVDNASATGFVLPDPRGAAAGGASAFFFMRRAFAAADAWRFAGGGAASSAAGAAGAASLRFICSRNEPSFENF